MIDDRELVRGKIRTALGRVDGEDLPQPTAVDGPPIPAIADEKPDTILTRFKSGVEKAAGTFDQVSDWSEVPQAVAEYLRQHNLAPAVTAAPDERLTSLEWTGIEFQAGAGDRHMEVGLSLGFAGLAETGSVAQASGRSGRNRLGGPGIGPELTSASGLRACQ